MTQPPSFTDSKTTTPAGTTGYAPWSPLTYNISTRYCPHRQ